MLLCPLQTKLNTKTSKPRAKPTQGLKGKYHQVWYRKTHEGPFSWSNTYGDALCGPDLHVPEHHVLVLDIMETLPFNYYFTHQSDFSRVFSTWHSYTSLNTFSTSRSHKMLRENLRGGFSYYSHKRQQWKASPLPAVQKQPRAC